MLLEQAQPHAQTDAHHGTEEGEQAPFGEEDTAHPLRRETEMAQGRDVSSLFEHEHGKRRDDVEAGDEEDEGEKNVGNEFFDLHHVEHIGLLLHAVEHLEVRAGQAPQLFLHGVDISSGAEFEFKARNKPLFLKQSSGEREGGEDVVVVVFSLVDGEIDTVGVEIVDRKRFDGVGDVDAFAGTRGADLQFAEVGSTDLLFESLPEDAVVDFGRGEQEFGMCLMVGAQDGADVRHAGILVVDAFDFHHQRMSAKEDEGIFLKGGRSGSHILLCANFQQSGIIGSGNLSLSRHDDQLGVEGGVESGDEVAETIEHAEHANHRYRGHRHSAHRDGRDDVDGVVALFGKEVAAGNEKGKGHK